VTIGDATEQRATHRLTKWTALGGGRGDHEALTPAPNAVTVSAATAPLGTYVRCGPGEAISHARPGDILLIRGVGRLGRSIRWFERLCARGREDRAFAHWSHAAVVVSGGLLVEVQHTGVALTAIEKYRAQEYHYVRLDLSDADRAKVASYAFSCLRQKYGRWSFVLLAIAKLLGGGLHVPDRGQQGCVALIVRALQRAGVPFERGPTDMSVADLARRFGVRP
jgi:hypothetical protein